MDPAFHRGIAGDFRPTETSGDQGDMFAAPVDASKHEKKRRLLSPQSVAAYEAAQPTALSKKQRIHGVILAAGARGTTRLGIVRTTGYLRDTVNARVRELLDDPTTGLVECGVIDGEGRLLHESHLAPGDTPLPRRARP